MSFGPLPPGPFTPSASWRVDAVLVRAAFRSRSGVNVPWRLSLSALSRRPILQELAVPTFCSGTPNTFVLSCIEEGSPLGRPIIGSHAYMDANGDGIIAESEVTIGTTNSVGDSPDPSWVLALTGDIVLRPGIRFGTVVESHLGQAAIDLAEFQRCRRQRCAALHDAGTPVEDQAAAVAAWVGGLYDISGFARDASFIRVREMHISLAPGFLKGSTLRLAAHQLLAWTRFPSGDPEAMPRNGAVASGAAGYHEGIRPSFSVRIEMAPLRR